MAKKEKKPLTKKQKRKRKLIVFIVELVVVLILLGVVWVMSKMSKIDVDEMENDPILNPVTDETEETLKGYTNIALFGLDNRSNGSYSSGNTDTIMIASINNDTKEVKLVSVYRDTYLKVNLENDTYGKINSAYARGGAEGAVNALNANLDLNIEGYVAVDWYAVVQTINLLGGIDIEVTSQEASLINSRLEEIKGVTGYSYSGYVSGEGLQHLDGVQALSYARIRKTAGDDFRRTERQRLVVQKMVEKALASDVKTVISIIDAVFPNISTSLSYKRMVSLAASAFSYRLTENTGFPTLRSAASISGAGSCVIACDLATNVAELHKFLFGIENYTPSETVVGISNEIVYRTGKTAEDAVQ